jgi:hypothetical protein
VEGVWKVWSYMQWNCNFFFPFSCSVLTYSRKLYSNIQGYTFFMEWSHRTNINIYIYMHTHLCLVWMCFTPRTWPPDLKLLNLMNYVRVIVDVMWKRNIICVLCLSWFSGFMIILRWSGPPLRSSGQSSWLQIQGSRVRFPGTTKKSSGSGTGSTQPREYNW